MFLNPYNKTFIKQGKATLQNQIGQIPIIAKDFVTSQFKILTSFLFDGVNERINIPNAALVSTLSGSTCKFSVSALVYLNSAGVNTILGNWETPNHSLTIYINPSGNIYFTQRNVGVTRSSLTTETLSLNNWYFITVNFDYSKTAGSKITIFANGSSLTVSDSSGVVIDVPTGDYKIGSYNSSNFLNGYLSMLAINNDTLTLSEHQTFYNSGKPLNPITLFGVKNILFFNPDNSGSTAQFTISDAVHSINATTINMEDTDKTTFTPY